MKKVIVFFLFLSINVYSQELNCNVVVNYESLPVINRELLAGFGSAIEAYMNTNQFSDNAWGQKIDCSMNIFFTSASGETEYSAQVVIVSSRPVLNSERQSPVITINDPNWSFRYEKNQQLYSQSSFEPLTGFLDFYANLIIGFDTDTFEQLGGNSYFRKAFDIVNLGNSSSYSRGWERTSESYNKWVLCEDLLSDKYRQFREDYFIYHYGVDEMQFDKPSAQQKIVRLIDNLDEMKKRTDINSVLIRTFFDTKFGEIIELLRDYPDPEIVAKLKRIDPAHAARYEEMLKFQP